MERERERERGSVLSAAVGSDVGIRETGASSGFSGSEAGLFPALPDGIWQSSLQLETNSEVWICSGRRGHKLLQGIKLVVAWDCWDSTG